MKPSGQGRSMRPPTPRTGRTGSRNAASREPAEPNERRRRDGERAPRPRRAPKYCRQHTAFLKEHVALPATATPVADRNRGNPRDADGESRDRFRSRRRRRLIDGDAGPDRNRGAPRAEDIEAATRDRSEAKPVEPRQRGNFPLESGGPRTQVGPRADRPATTFQPTRTATRRASREFAQEFERTSTEPAGLPELKNLRGASERTANPGASRRDN